MTKKDYVLIAEEVKKLYVDNQDSGESEVLERLVENLCDKLYSENVRFNKYTFTRACGITKGYGK